MTPAWMPLREVEPRPPSFPPGYLMAVFVGYGDESGKQDDPKSPSSAYGILVGPDECWDSFDEAWIKALHRAGIERFHRKEFGKPGGPYAHLDESSERALSIDLIQAIKDSGLEAYASAVRHSALEQFNDQKGLRLDAYALSLYTCLGYIGSQHLDGEVTLHLDWVENQYKKLACVQDYIATEPDMPELRGLFEMVRIIPEPKRTGRLAKAPGYQAADFLAWEARKYVHTDPNDDRLADSDGLIRPMDWPPQRRRKSLHALNEARGIQGTFWDVEVLENANVARRGVWMPGASPAHMIQRDNTRESDKEPIESWDDVRNSFKKLLKRPIDRFAWHRDILKRYLDGRLNIHIHGIVANELAQSRFCLDCHAILDDVGTNEPVAFPEAFDFNLGGAKTSNRQERGTVLVCVHELVKPLQRRISTRVQLRILDDRDGICGNAALRKTVKMVNVPLSPMGSGQQNREREDLTVTLPGEINRREEILLGQFPDDIVERGPDVCHAIPDDGTQSERRLGRQPGLDPPMVTVYLGFETIRLRIQESPAFHFEDVQVFCARTILSRVHGDVQSRVYTNAQGLISWQ